MNTTLQQKEFTSGTWNNMDGSQNNVEWKKPDKKEYILYDLIYIVSQKRKLIYSNRKQISGCLGGGRQEGKIAERHKETLGNNG